VFGNITYGAFGLADVVGYPSNLFPMLKTMTCGPVSTQRSPGFGCVANGSVLLASDPTPVHDTAPGEFARVTQVTYLGTVHGTLVALRRMLPRDSGVIVQVGSALAYRGIPLQAAYCAAKHAIQGFCDSLRAELLHDGSHVRVTMVQLPAINTPQFQWMRTNSSGDRGRSRRSTAGGVAHRVTSIRAPQFTVALEPSERASGRRPRSQPHPAADAAAGRRPDIADARTGCTRRTS
jgi:NAD(P)-dependent dehydrogenase (short-subunit alcohol dehydrogenase family)